MFCEFGFVLKIYMTRSDFPPYSLLICSKTLDIIAQAGQVFVESIITEGTSANAAEHNNIARRNAEKIFDFMIHSLPFDFDTVILLADCIKFMALITIPNNK